MTVYVGGNALTADDVNGRGELKNFYDLPTGGLLFNLNALNYTGASPWYDNVQNIAMTAAAGTPAARQTINNVPCVAFDGTLYWESTPNTLSRVDMTGEFTLIFVFYCTPLAVRKTIFEKVPNTYASYEQEIACTWEVDNNISFYTQVSTYDYGNFGVSTANQWNLRAIKMNASRDSASAWTSSAWTGNILTNRSDTAVVKAGGVRLGNGYAGVVTAGYIHACVIYGVALSTSEMTKVHGYYTNLFNKFNATLYN
jgi:hypothetical protein